ncbi:universal stress protein [Actinomadura sp. ATCC 31491]|uniref:Universal stress protein n=1 Tax=Actinomadura luzonensis TaxID=2805427 RepID=A0ABT0FVA6_9ACTN|nr:universal stress protein [Actinomadura luzonensis]MCK2215910.1 universal stress protein [Actinomadura luzonensis]
MNAIVLGYDGSDFAMQAMDWALDEAELRKLPLVLTHAWQWPYGEAEEEAKAHLRKAAEHVLWHGAECARSTSSGVRVETDLYEGPPARRLTELSAGAELIVVGTRGLSGLPKAVVGSVAGYVAAHAECPVVVVRGPGPLPAAAEPGPVLVAGGTPVPAVLDFAAHEAALRQLTLVAAGDTAAWRAAHPGVEVRAEQGDRHPTLVVTGRQGAAAALENAPCPVAVVPAGNQA